MLNTPMTYVEIGERLFISPRTVESHVDSLRRKLGATNRRELAWMWADSQHDAGLPAELSSFVGRESELRQTLDALAHARLVTLTGPGGVGKTRLAVRAARRWMKGPADAAGTSTSSRCLPGRASRRLWRRRAARRRPVVWRPRSQRGCQVRPHCWSSTTPSTCWTLRPG